VWRQPENAVASASISSALMLLPSRHLASIWSGWSVQVRESFQPLGLDLPQRVPLSLVWEPPLSWISDPAQVALPASIDALNRLEPSGGDLASTASASDIHPRSSRVGCLDGGVGFSPDNRNQGR
jgi:hypothetical protein